MSIQQENQGTKAIYTKPTLSEYGSLAERTKIFGLEPESDVTIIAPGFVTTGTPSTTIFLT